MNSNSPLSSLKTFLCRRRVLLLFQRMIHHVLLLFQILLLYDIKKEIMLGN
jgi:hypothetical protein